MLPNRTAYSTPLSTPRMTYYTRVISNITGEQHLGWVSTARVKDLYFGLVDGVNGGESDFIVEYDIHNNEVYGWSANGPTITCLDAVNCSMYVEIPAECRSLCPFLYARCVTYSPEAEWEKIDCQTPEFKTIQGLCSPEFGTILGTGDHAIIQMKVKLKKNSNICKLKYPFTVRFTYQFKR